MTVTHPPRTGSPAGEQVNHPAHYNSHPSGVECIELLRGRELRLSSVIKYLWRNDHKHATPAEDVRKAHWYLRDFLGLPSAILAEPGIGEMTAKLRVVAECRFRDWINDPDSTPRTEDHIILALIDHDHSGAVEQLTELYREITTQEENA